MQDVGTHNPSPETSLHSEIGEGSLSKEKKQECRFNYALNHLLAQWTAYLTILALQISMGLLLSTWKPGDVAGHSNSARAASIAGVAALLAVEIVLVWRIRVLDGQVCEFIGGRRYPQLVTVATALGSILVAVWNGRLLCELI